MSFSTDLPAAWGPFRFDLSYAERRAGLRALLMAVRLHCGQRHAALECRLVLAEQSPNPMNLADAMGEFEELDMLDQRLVRASYAATIGRVTGDRNHG